MAPALLTALNVGELLDIARHVREWQTGKGISDAELCRKFGELGSTKTYKKILDQQFQELTSSASSGTTAPPGP